MWIEYLKKLVCLVKALRTRTFHGRLGRGVYRIVAKAEKVDQTTECFVRVASGCQDFQLHSNKVWGVGAGYFFVISLFANLTYLLSKIQVIDIYTYDFFYHSTKNLKAILHILLNGENCKYSYNLREGEAPNSLWHFNQYMQLCTDISKSSLYNCSSSVGRD